MGHTAKSSGMASPISSSISKVVLETERLYHPEIALQEQVCLGVRLQNTKRSSYFTEIHVDFTAYRVHFTEFVK